MVIFALLVGSLGATITSNMPGDSESTIMTKLVSVSVRPSLSVTVKVTV